MKRRAGALPVLQRDPSTQKQRKGSHGQRRVLAWRLDLSAKDPKGVILIVVVLDWLAHSGVLYSQLPPSGVVESGVRQR